MHIRDIQAIDIPACASIMARNPLWERYNITYDSALARLNSGYENSATILIAEIDSRVVGFVWYARKGAFNRSGYIMLIGVDLDIQSRGVGLALMHAAEQEIVKSSQDVFLLVSDFNLGAQRFYQRMGYQQIGSIDDYVVPGVTELIYRKRIHE